MAGLDPFQPDQDYGVYCHAPAAGMCAGCGALCCPDCVELVMGWTTQRAVCRSCAEQGEQPRNPSRRWPIALLLLALVALLFLFAH